ncbi:receptor-like protein EIX2 [Lactuca sativa]|uniref:receptor-like protein EIX2 n=1 Tax=Lactuca sativa TaxID=4236 RepID=UPI001C68FFD9|nr:receptor-like protein EIX2 [Lactuca sativa]
MNPCVFIIFSLLLLCLETITSNQLVAAGGGDDNDVRNKCSDKERRALLDFKARLQDPDETLSTWRSEEEEDCCNWSGVTCNNQTGRVIELNISSGGLEGEISNSLLNLSYLTHLDVFSNSFHGIIPMFIGSMTRLRYLHLGSNHLNGTIPRSIGSLRKLRHLDLSDNSHCGIIPLEFGNLTNLQVLNLGSLRKSRVWNLEWLSHLSHLEALEMDEISLAKQNYSIDVILRLQKLISLSLDGCEVSHVVYPYSSSFLNSSSSSIESLILSNNNLTTSMYHWLFRLTRNKLRILDLSGNILDGIPKYLDLSVNNLHGTIPSCLDNLTSMVQEGFLPTHNVHSYTLKLFYSGGYHYGERDDKYFDHAMIEWKGYERELISTLGLLKSIDLSSNNLTGPIPYEVTKLYGLHALNLSKNSLLGEIPETIGQMKQLETLDLSRNNLSGDMSSSMSSMNFLNHLDVSYNSLSGRIPSNTQLLSFEASRYYGNPRLCGPPLTKNCQGDDESEVPHVIGESEDGGEDMDELWGWFYIGGGTGFVTGFWIVCGALLLNHHRRHAFFHFYDSFKDLVYVKVMVFFANLQRVEHR